MDVKINDVSSVVKKLSVSIPEKSVQEELDKAYNKLKKQANIPGFRKGKVPRSLLEKRFGGSIEAQVYEELVRDSVYEAIQKNELKAINVTEVSEPKREEGKGFSYTASIEVKPEFEPKKYTGIKVKSEKTKITEKEITAALDHMRESQSVLKPREKAVAPKKGDFVSITVEPLIAKPGEGNQAAQDQMYEIGVEGGQEALDKALVKMSLESSETVSLYNHQTKEDMKVKVTLKAIKEKVIPKLDDDFAKSVGQYENVKALKDKVKEDLEKEAEKRVQSQNGQKLLEELVKTNPIDLPESLIKNEMAQMVEGIKNQMRWSGVNDFPQDFSEEKMSEELKPDAQKRVHEQLLLEAIAEKEKIEVDEKELNDRVSELAKSSKVPTGELRAYYEKTGRMGSLRFEMVSQKTLDFLLSKATIS